MNTTRQRNTPEINSGSMADIAFLLLIFFLVSTTIITETGIRVKLPKWQERDIIVDVSERNVLSIKLNAAGELMVEGEESRLDFLTSIIKEHITNPTNSPTKPSSPKHAVISLINDRSTAYEDYINVYDRIKTAYKELWQEQAKKQYGLNYDELKSDYQEVIRNQIPMVVSEAEPTDFFRAE